MLRAIDQPYAAGVDTFLLRPWWSIGLSGRPMVPRPRRYSRPNRASRPSDAISLLHPSLLPGHQPVHPSLSLSSAVLNRARALRRAISKFPTNKKENRYSLSSLLVSRIPLVDTSLLRIPLSGFLNMKRTRLATNGRTSRDRYAGKIPIQHHAVWGKVNKETKEQGTNKNRHREQKK